MANQSNSPHSDYRQLPDVFRELQQTRDFYEQLHKTNGKTPFFASPKPVTRKCIPWSGIMIVFVLVVLLALVSSTSIFAKDNAVVEVFEPQEQTDFEVNRHRFNIQNVISNNASLEMVKEQLVEQREIPFETTTLENTALPKGEQLIIQQGVVGKKNVSLVKTYENGEYKEETILEEQKTVDPVPQIVAVGTSQFLAKLKIHVGDVIYLTSTTVLREEPKTSGKELTEIKKSLDVKLLELTSEQWCRVSLDGEEGYLPTKNLTSATATPSIVEQNRIQRILVKVNIDMDLNKPSGLTLKDYQKIFSNLSQDTNGIFKANAEVFYNIEKTYKINGIFLASIAIHESNWGTSQIANDKKNLFGYGAYDSTPYESSFTFETYEEGIDLVARSLVKYYINPPGTKIYNGELAVSTYYNGSTVADVNKRYASDENWHARVYYYMDYLYNRLS